MSAAAVVVILNPKTKPKSAQAGSNARTYEVEIAESATDAEVIAALKLQLESEAE